ncbi:hypothetical protein D3C80_1207780 [compost metagenome]
MCAAEVSFRPSAMNKNSTPNSAPASSPPRQVCATWSQPPRKQISRPTSTAAMPERRACCITGAMSGAASLIITCWMPQIRHSTSITCRAKASVLRRVALIAGTRYRRTAWQSLGSCGSSADYQRLQALIASLVLRFD